MAQNAVQPPLRRAVNMQDIADQCGVSKMTVSRAFRPQSRNISPVTRERIMEVAREYGYHPDNSMAARQLAARRSGMTVSTRTLIVMISGEFIHDAFYNRTFWAILDALTAANYDVLTHRMPRFAEQNRFPLAMRRGDIDGGIYIGGVSDWIPILTNEMNTVNSHPSRPLVSVYAHAAGSPSVTIDGYSGGYQLASHLLSLGHRHLIYSYYEEPDHIDRINGFRQAYAEYDLTASDYLHYVPWSEAQYTSSLHNTLIEHPEITGVIAPNDPFAMLAYHGLVRQGWRIPEDISLTGFDDTVKIPDQEGKNLLTTIRVPLEEAGREAAQLLLQALNGSLDPNTHLALPVTLEVRNSTAPPCARQ